jgi:hypothetical protein
MQYSVIRDNLRRFFTGRPSRDSYNPAVQDNTESDISYEDALLDSQLRAYFRSEYGTAHPPSRVLPRLLAAIRAHERGETTASATRPVAAFLSLYQALHTSAAHRMVSGAIAAVLLIAILSSNSVQLLRGTAVSSVDEVVGPTPSAVMNSRADFELATTRDDRYVMRLPSIPSEPAFYDAVERRVPPRIESASGSTTPGRWLRLGGQ